MCKGLSSPDKLAKRSMTSVDINASHEAVSPTWILVMSARASDASIGSVLIAIGGGHVPVVGIEGGVGALAQMRHEQHAGSRPVDRLKEHREVRGRLGRKAGVRQWRHQPPRRAEEVENRHSLRACILDDLADDL